jgi:opacity protein-like surface antigen
VNEQHLRFPGISDDVTISPTREGGQTRQTNAGWFVGGGLQYALTEHWSVRAQYEYSTWEVSILAATFLMTAISTQS